MALTVRTFNRFMFFKLPSAWWTGVRLRELTREQAETSVQLRWINQNPFRSMFWAVQGMAAEMATGALLMHHVRECNQPVSMLVLNNKASFTKKATGRIRFTCTDGSKVRDAVEKALETRRGETVWMRSTGRDQQGDVVSVFDFEWTLKARS